MLRQSRQRRAAPSMQSMPQLPSREPERTARESKRSSSLSSSPEEASPVRRRHAPTHVEAAKVNPQTPPTAGAAQGSPEQEGGPVSRLSEPAIAAVHRMTVSQLRRLLDRAGVPHADCVEKAELRGRLVAAVERGSASNFGESPPGPATPTSTPPGSRPGSPTGHAGPGSGSSQGFAPRSWTRQAHVAAAAGDSRSASPMQPSSAHTRASHDRSVASAAARLADRYASPPNKQEAAASR